MPECLNSANLPFLEQFLLLTPPFKLCLHITIVFISSIKRLLQQHTIYNMDTESTSSLSELNSVQIEQDTLPGIPTTSIQSSGSNASTMAHHLWNRRAAKKKGKPKKGVWKHARDHLSNEAKTDKNKHMYFYCSYCSWRSIAANARNHLKKEHNIDVEDESTPAQTHIQQTINASFSQA